LQKFTYLQILKSKKVLKVYLDKLAGEHNNPAFILSDPVQVPHRFNDPNDVEISGFLTSSIAWGQRTTIITNAGRLMEGMGNSPYDFIMNFKDPDFVSFSNFNHRTFNPSDCFYFMKSLQNIYRNHGGLRTIFENTYCKTGCIADTIIEFRRIFFELPHQHRTEKHIPDISKNSAAKRLNLFLMWMVRKDKSGVHFGLWEKIPMSTLYIPLDIHVARNARRLGLLKHKQNDWKAVVELTMKLRELDPDDPVKYDFALFAH
jgi:uncharacterized protein (TIGR02757 family)